MALWTDIIDPATLTGYARASLADYEARRGTLARFLPNRMVPDIVVRFLKGATGLIDVARFRAYDAELEIGNRPEKKRVTLELPALGIDLPVSEYEQIRARGGDVPDELALASIMQTTDLAVRSTADAIERLRGIVLATGRATIDQGERFQMDDDFGRPGSHAFTVPVTWDNTAADRLGQLEAAADLYRESGEEPGALLMSTRALRALAAGTQFRTVLGDGNFRPATQQQVRDLISSAGLPDIVVYDRRVRVNGAMVSALPNDRVFLLPSPVEPDDFQGTQLGATFWGRTLTSTEADWGIEDAEQPGIVTGVYRNEKPPMGIEVIADAIGLPVLANAELSMAVKVLP